MTDTDFVALAAKAGWSGVALLLAYSVYLAVSKMAPVWAERYRTQTHRITVRDARRGMDLVQKLKINGAEMKVIEDSLIGSNRFKEQLVGKILAEAREVSERVRVLEVKVEDVKSDIHDIRVYLQALPAVIDERAATLRDALVQSERRIVDQVLALYERRKEPRE